MDDQARYEAYVEELRREFPRFAIRPKRRSASQRLIDGFLRILTFGGNSSYLTAVVTTLGDKVYVPDGWDGWEPMAKYLILRHEAVHLRQFRRFTWPGMALIYLFLPIPVFFAGGRAWFELQAYKETLTATWELQGRDAAYRASLHDGIVSRFTGSDYGWMWLWGGSIRRALDRHMKDLERIKSV